MFTEAAERLLQQYLPLAVLKPDLNLELSSNTALQQYLPLAVLKQAKTNNNGEAKQQKLQQYLPLAVLKHDNFSSL